MRNLRPLRGYRSLSLIFGVCFAALSARAVPRPMHVMIDPGHGGTDTGTARGIAKESRIALQVGLKLRHILQTEGGYTVDMTRESDVNVSLPERVAKTTATKSDFLISIHVNSAPDMRAKGLEIYFQNLLPPDEESFFLASNENIMAESGGDDSSVVETEPTKKNDVLAIVDDLHRQNHVLKSYYLGRNLIDAWNAHAPVKDKALRQAPFYVVTHTKAPSVLVEIGYLTHSKEYHSLTSPEYQEELAQRIAEGIQLYRNSALHLNTEMN